MSDRAQVGINLLWLVPGVVGGSAEYATRQLEALALFPPDDLDLTVFALRPFTFAYPELAGAFRTVSLRLDGGVRPVRVGAESTWLARASRRRGLALVHHLGGRVPMVSPAPSVVTIHDLQPLERPRNFSLVKRRFLARALPASAARARVVVTPSDHVRRRVVELLHVPDARTAAIPAPVPVRTVPVHRPTVVPPALAALVDTRTPFFLYPAITYTHKNHATLLDAVALLRRDRPDVRLVLTGGSGDAEESVRARITGLGLGDAVLRVGRVPRPVLDWLIDHAAAVVFPSTFEGFGLPVIEAMASGCPVIAANATALPEVLDGAGVLVAPQDPNAWRDAMAAQLGSSRAAAAAAGRARAARFAHQQIARELHAVYRRGLDDGGRCPNR
jgi:alpha-1,3-rhamnosyl/mannosyltransferase